MKRFICLLILIRVALFSSAQAPDTIRFEKKYVELDRGSGTIPLYAWSGDSIYFREAGHRIRVPRTVDPAELAFGFVYFAGWPSMKVPSMSPILVAGYRSHDAKIYADLNQDLDFTNDGSPVSLHGTEDSVTLAYPNEKDPAAFYSVKLRFVNAADSESFRRKVSFFKNHPNGKRNTLVEPAYWLSEFRLNHLTAYGRLGGDSVYIGLKDYDCNGFYNNKKSDMVIIGNYQTGRMSARLSAGAYTFIDTTVIKPTRKYYRVLAIEPAGSYIVLQETDIRKVKLERGKPVPDFTVKTINQSLVRFRDLLDSTKYTLIDFWGAWCAPCRQQMPELMRMDSLYRSKLKIVGMNYGDDENTAAGYLFSNHITWANGYSNDVINDLMLVDGFPFLILVNKKKEVELFMATLDEVESRVKAAYRP